MWSWLWGWRADGLWLRAFGATAFLSLLARALVIDQTSGAIGGACKLAEVFFLFNDNASAEIDFGHEVNLTHSGLEGLAVGWLVGWLADGPSFR